jgi:hypothetical protein
MNVKIENNKLIIEIEINDPPVPSASGKSLVVATTRGNLQTDAMVKGKHVTIGLNAYIRR